MNVKEILLASGISFVPTGRNISQDHVGMACPLCNKEGNADPSYHLGIHVETGKWNCWRNPDHHGTLPYLLAELLHISTQEATKLVGASTLNLNIDFKAYIYGKLKNNQQTIPKKLVLPKSFHRISGAKNSATNYLIQRGFPYNTHKDLGEWYNLCFCKEETWEDRIIFPVYEYNQLLTWTGRSIYNTCKEKYKNLNNEQSVVSLQDTIWNHYWIKDLIQLYEGQCTLYLCEGPFDALKIDYFSNFNVLAIPIWGLTLTERQIAFLSTLPQNKVKIVIVLDKDAEMKVLKLQQKLIHIHTEKRLLPRGVKDPGSMTSTQIREFFT